MERPPYFMRVGVAGSSSYVLAQEALQDNSGLMQLPLEIRHQIIEYVLLGEKAARQPGPIGTASHRDSTQGWEATAMQVSCLCQEYAVHWAVTSLSPVVS